ncbi:unnamed protein product [Sympodiomycopsis kandeliae]
MSDSSQKLTKKQKKAADFKAGKGGAGKKSGKKSADLQDDIPQEDLLGDEIADGQEGKSIDVKENSSSKKRKRNNAADLPEDEDAHVAPETKTTPKNEANNTSSASANKNKISFDEDGNAVVKKKLKRRKKAGSNTEAEGGAPRLIVFVGNMSFKTTSEKILEHFKSHCGETPTVRLLTTKSDPSKLSAAKRKSVEKGKASDTTIRSKGCAFVQFTKAAALQKALGLHHTQFEGRLINVELTAGGGGSGADRKKKIQEKNAKLEEERSKLHEKYWKPQDEERKKTNQEKRESGQDVGPPKKKLEGEAQWGKRGQTNGGDQQAQKSKRPKWMASGANAVRLED